MVVPAVGQCRSAGLLPREVRRNLRGRAKGRRIGRPSVVDPDKLAYAAHLHESGHTITEIVAKTGITRTTLYRHLPPRAPEPVTAEPVTAAEPDPGPVD
ncbi:helix-turn-helix domain-containing protein [Kocuria sabuli]|uniref:helix-turn-helix domain-containing protein n=1 Tax=Kocuria sabuli TaxID=3071448 RepID=UPI0034D41795